MHDLSALLNRLKKVQRQRRSWAARLSTEAYRLYDHDIPELRYIVDVYGQHAVVYDRSRGGAEQADEQELEAVSAGEQAPLIAAASDQAPGHHEQAAAPALEEIQETVAAALGLPLAQVHLKSRRRMPGANQYQKLGTQGQRLVIREGRARFLVNLDDYLDTGLFLDHRPLRYQLAQGPARRVLNLFCYTGSVSVAAALAGSFTTSVDLSNTYLAWAEENFALNALAPASHEFVRADAREYLKNGLGSTKPYDLIFLDPPTFSNSKKMQGSFDVQRDHARLIEWALGFLAPGGELYFSTNRRQFRLDESLARRAASIEDLSQQTIPEDFRDRKIHRCYLLRQRSL